MKRIKLCKCSCHEEGLNTKHIIPCCPATYEKYLNQNGDIIPERLEIIKNRLRKAFDIELVENA
jgi:hypothetical protein